ncbi:MAG: ribosome recycling factor [Candidatus Paceibacterota bacterium]
MDTDITKKLDDVVAWLQGEYAGIRSGQATPALLDAIKVENYGSLMPLNQVGSVGIEDARTLRISPWDASSIKAIETAIADADLGVSVATDSSGLRVIFPELTSERREQILKLAKTKLEDARVRVRGVRDDVMKQHEAAKKAGDLSEDELFTKKESVQKLVDSTNQKLEDMYTAKETEIKR